MHKQRLISNHLSILRRLISSAQKAIPCWSKRTKKTSIGSTVMRLLATIKKRLNPITPLPLINLGPRPSKSVKKVGKEAFKPRESMPAR